MTVICIKWGVWCILGRGAVWEQDNAFHKAYPDTIAQTCSLQPPHLFAYTADYFINNWLGFTHSNKWLLSWVAPKFVQKPVKLKGLWYLELKLICCRSKDELSEICCDLRRSSSLKKTAGCFISWLKRRKGVRWWREGKQGWLVGRWRGRDWKKAFFEFSKRERECFPCLLPLCCQTRSVVRSSDAARLTDSHFAQWSLRGPTMHFTFNLALPGTWLSGSALMKWDKAGGGGQYLGLWQVLQGGGSK